MRKLGKLVTVSLVFLGAQGDLQAASTECYGDTEQSRYMMEGARLSRDAIRDLEDDIKRTPDEVMLRIKASGYYLYGEKLSVENALSFSDHVLWLIDKCPASFLIANLSTYRRHPIFSSTCI